MTALNKIALRMRLARALGQDIGAPEPRFFVSRRRGVVEVVTIPSPKRDKVMVVAFMVKKKSYKRGYTRVMGAFWEN